MIKYIEPFYFFIALFIGMFLVYISTPTPKIVIKYPTPENSSKLIYKDDADTCYKYIAEEIECPADRSKIKRLDIQHVDKDEEQKKNVFSWI